MTEPRRAVRAAAVLAAALAAGAPTPGCSDSTNASEGKPRVDASGSTALVVMTFNVLCWACSTQNGADYDPWETRLTYFEDVFARHDADLIGLQELAPKVTLPTDVQQILGVAPGYEAVFYSDDQQDYPDATLLVRTSRFTVLETGDYWLSPTPDEPRSTGFADGAQLARLVVWAKLHDELADRDLYFATTHFDNNPPSQDKSAPLVMERTMPWIGTHPVVFTGDFNSNPSDAAYETLTNRSGAAGFSFLDTYELTESPRIVSNQMPRPTYDAAKRIDHVFVVSPEGGPRWTASDWVADLTVYGPDSKYPSDHRPIVATIRLE